MRLAHRCPSRQRREPAFFAVQAAATPCLGDGFLSVGTRTTLRVVQLTSDRLTLRAFTVGDLDAVHAFASDPVVTRYTDWGPNDESASRAFVDEACQPDAFAGDDFTFAITRTDTAEVIGSAAVWIESRVHARAELGYTLAANSWGRGLGTEVASLLVDFAFEHLRAFRVGATCHPDNVGSIRVLEKAGLSYEGRLRGHLLVRGDRRDSLVYGVVADDRLQR